MSNPPPYVPEETKGLYPSVQGDPQQQQTVSTVASAPGMASVTYYPQGQQQQPQPLVIQQPGPVLVTQQHHAPSLICHIVMAYCTSLFCFCPCGFIAFILASTFMIYVFCSVRSWIVEILLLSDARNGNLTMPIFQFYAVAKRSK